MNALICCVVNILLIALCLYKNRDIFHPVCILNLMWLAVHSLNVILGWNSGEKEYLILMLPSLFFSIGFYITEKYDFFKFKKRKNAKLGESAYELGALHPMISNALLAFVVVIFVCYAYAFISRLDEYPGDNIWYAFRRVTWDYNVNDQFVFKYSSTVAFLLPSVLLVSAQKSRKPVEYAKFLISLVIAVIWSILRTSRTSTFSVIIIMVMSQILLMENKGSVPLSQKERAAIGRKKIGVFAVAVAFILAVFLYVALQKETNSYGDVSVFEFFIKSIANYTNLSSAAFVEWYKQGVTYTYGTNSFRFVIAVLNKLGLIATQPAANSGGLFITFEGLRTNAFTVARAYIEDFGVGFMALMLMVFGMIHGAVYKKACKSSGLTKIRFALINAMLNIPLFFQILTNQYLNVLSGWIQYVFWICLFTWSVFWKKTNPESGDQMPAQ